MSSEPNQNESDLSNVASEEEGFVRERLSSELGRQPTQEEVDEWLREHTEGY
jgi:hypothetical protein